IAEGPAGAARRCAAARIQGDVRPAADADSPSARHDQREESCADGARHAHERFRQTVNRPFSCYLRWGIAAALAASTTAVHGQGRGQTQTPGGPAFRAGVELVSLNVTVTEGGGPHFVTDLEASDFNVYEDGVKQDVTFFNKTNLPVALALLLDTSA